MQVVPSVSRRPETIPFKRAPARSRIAPLPPFRTTKHDLAGWTEARTGQEMVRDSLQLGKPDGQLFNGYC